MLKETTFRRRSIVKMPRCSGSVLLLSAAMAIALISFVILGLEYCKYRAIELAHNAATEAVALACAKELSRVVIDDPHFGLVALTDQPPGKRALLENGEYVPVRGINSLEASLRQSTVIASQLGANQIMALVDIDLEALEQTKGLLIAAWEDALLPEQKSRSIAKDIEGNPIHLPSTAAQVFERCFNGVPVESRVIKLQLMSTKGGGCTTIIAPQPLADAFLTKDELYGDCYASDKNLPVADRSFCFASTAPEPRTLSDANVAFPSKGQMATVVRVHARCKLKDANINPLASYFGAERLLCNFAASVCAIPPAYKAASNGSSLILAFPEGKVAGASSLKDLLTAKIDRNDQVMSFAPAYGDYPYDSRATLSQIDSIAKQSSITAQCVYDFMRSTNVFGKNTVSSMLAKFSCPVLAPGETQYPAFWLVFYLDDDGSLEKQLLNRSPIITAVTADGQEGGYANLYSYSPPLLLSYQDETRRIGANSGKHGGKPLSFDYINRLSVVDANDWWQGSYSEKLDSSRNRARTIKLRLAAELDFRLIAQSPPKITPRK